MQHWGGISRALARYYARDCAASPPARQPGRQAARETNKHYQFINLHTVCVDSLLLI